MRASSLGLMVAWALTGCGVSLFSGGDTDEAAINPEVEGLSEIRPVARPESVSQTSNVAAKTGNLGVTVATLDATEPGLWLKTPLVDTRQSGSILFGAKRLNVTLIPIEGADTAGSLISLDAMKAIGAPLTGFPELTVFGA